MIEIIVSVTILAMVAVLIHGVTDSLSRGKKGEALRTARAHEAREVMQRITRDLSSAYLSMHVPPVTALITSKTAFVGHNSDPFDRIDFTAFAHIRTSRDTPESDQAEVGYFARPDPDVEGQMDLVRREESPIDFEPLKGGVPDIVAENIESFNVRFFDPKTGLWTDSWDTTQISGQPNRLPLEVEVSLVLKGVGSEPPYSYTTKVFLPIQQPLSFGIPQ